MNEFITNWLSQQDINEAYLPFLTSLAGVLVIIFIALVIFYIAKYQVLKFVSKIILSTKKHLG